jgi:hypothetical protein
MGKFGLTQSNTPEECGNKVTENIPTAPNNSFDWTPAEAAFHHQS